MNSRESAALDRHITGNYGEDQFEKPAQDPYTRAMRLALARLTVNWQRPAQLKASRKTLDRLVSFGEAERRRETGLVQYRLPGIESI